MSVSLRDGLIRIETSFFVAGVDWNATIVDKVTHYDHRCAPIINYMRHWSLNKILLYCARRGWGRLGEE